MKQMLQAAIDYHKAGLSVVPTNSHKIPTVPEWTSFQQEPADEATIRRMFANGESVALIGGAVSGNLEILDFDCAGEAVKGWADLVKSEDPDLAGVLPYESTPSGGGHIVFRCPEVTIPGAAKLAQKKVLVSGPGKHEYANKTHEAKLVNGRWYIAPCLIETRGEGSYAVVNPSPGYVLKKNDFRKPPVITAKQRDLLINSARALNEWAPLPDTAKPQRTPQPQGSSDLSPGDDYSNRADIRALLERHGWVKVNEGGFKGSKTERYRRPGKSHGWSASLIDGRIFHNFSGNADPFEMDKAYAPFSVYGFLEHGGDFSEAARTLVQQGYGATAAQGTPNHMTNQDPRPGKTPKKSKPKGMTLKQLKSVFKAEITYLWRDHFPHGLPVIYAGREGMGKTSILIQAGKEIVEQNPEGTVVWFASEGSVQDTVAKLEDAGVGERFVVGQKSDGTFKWNLNNYNDLKELDTLLGSLDAPILAVFIDSIRGITPYGDSEEKIKNVIQSVNALVCDKYHAALIYIHHFKKGHANTIQDMLAGSTGIPSSVRAVYAVMPSSGVVRKIKQAKSNLPGTRPELEAIKVGEKIVIVESQHQSDSTMEKRAEEFLVNVFKAESRIRATKLYEMGKKVGLSSSSLKAAKANLKFIEAKNNGKGTPWYWVCTVTLGAQKNRGVPLNRFAFPHDFTKKQEDVTTCNYNEGHEGHEGQGGSVEGHEGHEGHEGQKEIRL